VAFNRGTPAGEYTVNPHLYRYDAGRMPIPAVAVIGLKRGPDDPLRPFATKRVELARIGERPSDPGVDQREPMFYAEPRPALPPKTLLPG
jgi:hypothetical protein